VVPAERITAVEARLEAAKRIVDAKMPEARDLDGYHHLVTEAFRQLQNDEWLELEKRKVR
jgi:hypothetical protein